MAVIREDKPASSQDLHVQQLLFTVHEVLAQETDAGRLVYIAQATGLRMTRTEDGQFIGLNGEVVTEADLVEGFLTPTVKSTRLEMRIGFSNDTEVRVENLRDEIRSNKFTKVKTVLTELAEFALGQMADEMEYGTLDTSTNSPLDSI